MSFQKDVRLQNCSPVYATVNVGHDGEEEVE